MTSRSQEKAEFTEAPTWIPLPHASLRYVFFLSAQVWPGFPKLKLFCFLFFSLPNSAQQPAGEARRTSLKESGTITPWIRMLWQNCGNWQVSLHEITHLLWFGCDAQGLWGQWSEWAFFGRVPIAHWTEEIRVPLSLWLTWEGWHLEPLPAACDLTILCEAPGIYVFKHCCWLR